MRHSEHDDVNLAEVKAILGRLQRISRKPSAGGDDAAWPQSGPSAQPAEVEDVGEAPTVTTPAKAPRPVKAAVIIVPVIAVLAGVVFFVGIDRQPASTTETSPDAPHPPVPDSAPVQAPEPAPAPEAKKDVAKSPVLATASELMATGQVKAARAALLHAMRGDTADIAWTLARSYDPNFLVTIPAADSGPDVAEATRWYRTWYDIAVKQGLVSDSVSLERIIRSMN